MTPYTVTWSYETYADSAQEAAEIAASVAATGSDPAATRRGFMLVSVAADDVPLGDFEVSVPSTEAISYAEYGAGL